MMQYIAASRIWLWLLVALIVTSAVPLVAHTQQLVNQDRGIMKARVISAGEGMPREVIGTGTETLIQPLTVTIIDGAAAGREVAIENEFETTLEVGDIVFVQQFIDVGGREWFTLFEIQRAPQLGVLFAAFAVMLLLFGGAQGARALVALAGSLLAIVYILVPAILAGYNPIITSIGVAVVVLFLALFFTHGFNRVALSAFLGTVIAIIITGCIAWFSIEFLDLTGIASENEVYLNFNTDGALDFVGLLLGAIIIGVLGALDDIAITQAATVRELYGVSSTIARRDVFTRALRIGKDHVSALVNTLILAYTGAALPLLLLFLQQNDISYILNIEIFATEVVRMIVGSIGLILAVPFTTAIAAVLLERYRGNQSDVVMGAHTHVR